ncbi:MAG: hypothetical protein ACD_78C00461G0005, partial [uncultured bacterium (gcode 4)]
MSFRPKWRNPFWLPLLKQNFLDREFIFCNFFENTIILSIQRDSSTLLGMTSGKDYNPTTSFTSCIFAS